MEEVPRMLGWLWSPGQNWERRMPRMEGCVWKKVDHSVVDLQSKLTIQKGEDKKVNAKSFYFTSLARKSHHLAPVVQTLESVIHRINHYPADSVIASHAGVFRGARFVGRDEKRVPLKTPAWEANSVIDVRNTYPLDSAIQRLNNRGLTDKPEVDGALIPPGLSYPIWRILKGTQSLKT